MVISVTVKTGRSVDLTFSKAVSDDALEGENYVVSGDGQGTLSDHPDSVVHAGGNVYTLMWNDGEMFIGGDITITVVGVLDAAGHPTGAPSSATHQDGGVGAVPEVTARTPIPGTDITTSEVHLDVEFSEAVQGVDASDLVLTGTAAGAAEVGQPTDQGGDVWRFPVTGLVTGELAVSLAPDVDDIEDLAGNGLANLAWSYNVDVDPPTVTARTPAPGSTVTTKTLDIDITFSEQVKTPGKAALVLSGSAAAGATLSDPASQGGNTWRFTVSGLVDGALGVSLAPNAGDIEDLVGHDLANVTWGYTVGVVLHPYDANKNWVIEDAELTAMKSDWSDGTIADFDPDFFVLWTINLYTAGGYDYVHANTGYKVWQREE